ncbi:MULTISPECIES: hypothetical protein [unclassified Methylococcus]|uniref:hypothetical protein n=1 Tax=unclassified Methylococcus TaxID=2618889 RepID=UPI003D7C7BF2
MAKTPVLVCLDTDLIAQIKAVLPDTKFNSIEDAIADLVGDGITGDHAVWAKAISWQPGEAEEEPSPADRYEIGHIPREIAAKINPIISSTSPEDTLCNCSELCEAIGEMASEDHAFSRDDDYRFLLGYAVAAALKYEAAFSAVRRKQL